MEQETVAEYTVPTAKRAAEEYFVDPVQVNKGSVYFAAKRCFDIICSLVGIGVLLIPMLLIGIVICLDSRGPAIFKQDRLGKNGKPFTIYKFRSMFVDAETDGPQWASPGDKRCTRVGGFLRDSHLDELPQLFNILKGDMSVVGPRPEREHFYDEFETYIHGFRNRLVVWPGLTGLAQINGGYDLRPEEKIVHDMEYIRRQSLWLDMYCVFKTVRLVFTHEGAR